MGSLLLLVGLLQAPVAAKADPAFHSPELELSRVNYLQRLPSGDLLLVDGPGSTIQRLDSLGNVLTPFARTGGGPGEVRMVYGMGWARDTMWTLDGGQGRFTYYSRDLKHLGTQSYLDRCGHFPWAIMATGQCLVLVQPQLGPAEPDPDSIPMILTEGKRADTLFMMAFPSTRIRYGDAVSFIAQPFTDTPLTPKSNNGRFLGIIRRHNSGTVKGPKIAVEIRDLVQQKRYSFFVPYVMRELTADSVSRYLASVKRPDNPTFPGINDSTARRLKRPPFLPAIVSASIDDRGYLYIRDQDAPGSGTGLYRVFTPAGVERLRFTLPAAVKIYNYSPPRLIGVVLDADDVPELVQYRIPVLPD